MDRRRLPPLFLHLQPQFYKPAAGFGAGFRTVFICPFVDLVSPVGGQAYSGHGILPRRWSAAPFYVYGNLHHLRLRKNALADPLHDQAVTVLLDLVESIPARRNLGSAGGDAGLENVLTHDREIVTTGTCCESRVPRD